MRYRPKSNVIFDDVSIADYNAFSFHCNVLDRPKRSVDVVAIPGRNGELSFDNGRYENVDRTYTIQVIGRDNLYNLQSALLAKKGYFRLEDEYDPEMYMVARLADPPQATKWVGEASAVVLSFSRKPQRFFKHGEKGVSVSNGAVIRNDTRYDAKPLVRVYGTGTLGIGSQTIQINQVDQYVDIDCELQDAYKEGTNCNGNIRLVSGEFFSLVPGNNGVQISGNITDVVITPRWWTI